MLPISGTALVGFVTQSLAHEPPDVPKLVAGPTASRGTVDPVAVVIAGARVSESTILAAVRDALEGGKSAAVLAGATVTKIGGTLIDLLKLVTSDQVGSQPLEDIQQQAEALLAATDGAVIEATVHGVNLIAGAVGGAVTATKFTIMGGLDGSVIIGGGVGVSAMNATAAGLGLAGFVATGRGATMAFHVSADNITAGGENPTMIRLRTTNYGDSLAETSRFPGKQWVFRFARPNAGDVSTETPLFDGAGNLLRLDDVVTVPLPLNFKANDAVALLGSAMTDRGFEVSVERSSAGVNILRIAGNNMDVSAVSVQNLNVAAAPSRPRESAEVRPDLSSATSAVHLQIDDDVADPSMLPEQSEAWVSVPLTDLATASGSAPPSAAASAPLPTPASARDPAPLPTPASAPGSTPPPAAASAPLPTPVLAPLPTPVSASTPDSAPPPILVSGSESTRASASALSPASPLAPAVTVANTDAIRKTDQPSMTMSAIPASSNLPGSGQVAAIILSVWEGQDAAVATLTSAVRKADAIAQILGGYVINLDELQHSLPDESNMMIASESLYLGAAVTKSEAEIAAAQLHQRRAQRRLTAGHPDMAGPMSQLLVRFFHWRRDHARRKPGEPRSIGGQGLADEFRSTGDHSEEVADEPFLEAGELDDKPD